VGLPIECKKEKIHLRKDFKLFLTEAGVEFSSKNIKNIKDQKNYTSRLRGLDKEIYESTKIRIMNSSAYSKILQNLNSEITLNEYREMFNLNKYLDKSQELEKVQKYLNMFVNEKDILNRIKLVSNKYIGR